MLMVFGIEPAVDEVVVAEDFADHDQSGAGDFGFADFGADCA